MTRRRFSSGFTPTTRVKSTGTLIDKLNRGSSFKSLQDVAGARLVVDGGRVDQDRAVARIVLAFTAVGSECRTMDRRECPNHGYRAVHVIVKHQALPVEIKVRTPLQDLWAQLAERLGDLWGRELRYGQPLNPPDQPLLEGMQPVFTREMFVDLLHNFGEEIHRVESTQMARYQEQPEIAQSMMEQRVSVRPLEPTEGTLLETLETLTKIVQSLEEG